MEEVLEEKSEKAKIADLIIENQVLRHKATILAELLYTVSEVLKYYSDSRLSCPLYTIVDPNNGAMSGTPRYKITDVLEPGPDKEFLLGKEIYDIKFDINTATKAYNEIFKIFKELDIEIKEDEPEESTKSEGEIDEN